MNFSTCTFFKFSNIFQWINFSIFIFKETYISPIIRQSAYSQWFNSFVRLHIGFKQKFDKVLKISLHPLNAMGDSDSEPPAKKRKGGQRQRLQVANQEEVARTAVSSRLGEWLKEKWSWGSFSPQILQEIATLALSDMEAARAQQLPEGLISLSRLGSCGAHQNNMHRVSWPCVTKGLATFCFLQFLNSICLCLLAPCIWGPHQAGVSWCFFTTAFASVFATRLPWRKRLAIDSAPTWTFPLLVEGSSWPLEAMLFTWRCWRLEELLVKIWCPSCHARISAQGEEKIQRETYPSWTPWGLSPNCWLWEGVGKTFAELQLAWSVGQSTCKIINFLCVGSLLAYYFSSLFWLC